MNGYAFSIISPEMSSAFVKIIWIFILNCTFLVRFGGISGEFGRAMVHAKIPMARPNEPDMPPKRTKKVRLVVNTVP